MKTKVTPTSKAKNLKPIVVGRATSQPKAKLPTFLSNILKVNK